MKTLIISDSHSKNPVDFIKSQADRGIEQLDFLGDCDFPDILEQILALPINKLVLSGNHEYGFSKGLDVDSSALRWPLARYIQLWQASRVQNFVLNPESHLAERIISGEKIIFCHGCLSALETSNPVLEGRLSSPLHSSNIPYNFKKMQENNCWILFRGHDHSPEILSLPRQANPFSAPAKKENRALTFRRDKLYIVTVGSFLEGNYGIFDEQALSFERYVLYKD